MHAPFATGASLKAALQAKRFAVGLSSLRGSATTRPSWAGEFWREVRIEEVEALGKRYFAAAQDRAAAQPRSDSSGPDAGPRGRRSQGDRGWEGGVR